MTVTRNMIICNLFVFVSLSLLTAFYMGCLHTAQPPDDIDVDLRGRLGPVQPHLASHCPIISVKDHRPSEARTMFRVSSPSPFVNLTGAARSGFWAFRSPTGVFVFEWAMMPMN
jgi:hypothetical protein